MTQYKVDVKKRGSFGLVHSSLNSLRAAFRLRELERTEEQVLKLLDDSAELMLKAILTHHGIDCARRHFPWLVRNCAPFISSSDQLLTMHSLRNRVKHSGEPVVDFSVVDAVTCIVDLAFELHGNAAVNYALCMKCRRMTPMLFDSGFVTSRPSGDRYSAKGWCVECDSKLFKFLESEEEIMSGSKRAPTRARLPKRDD